MSLSHDALLVVSFGGPEKREDVLPFLETVLRGKNVPRERLLEVAGHYYHFGGRSPINDQNRELIAAVSAEFERAGITLPVYWGNRNWNPFLKDAVARMRDDGVERALVFITSAFSSYSGCRQYLEDMDRARAEVGANAPELHKLRGFSNHPGFIASVAARVGDALAEARDAHLIFTAHSVPLAMANTSPYPAQLREACAAVAQQLGQDDWELAFQSRSGPPSQTWLEPDISDVLRRMPAGSEVVVSPIGFISDHMEVVYDLDTEAMQLAGELGIKMIRAKTPGTHPLFVSMIRELVEERLTGVAGMAVCAPDCCPAPRRSTL